MPRRPRPANRPVPKGSAKVSQPPKPVKAAAKPPPLPVAPTKRTFEAVESSEDEDEEADNDSDEKKEEPLEGKSSGNAVPEDDSNGDDSESGGGEGGDADAPRVVLWEEDREPVYDSGSEGEAEGKEIDETRLQESLQHIPFGSLRKAQTMLKTQDDSDDSESSDDDSESEGENKGKGREKVEWSLKPKKDIAKRKDKNAPTEVTSKRPVPRRRQVVEVPKLVPRDPRFLTVAGELDPVKFQQNYSFLADRHKKEVDELKAAIKKARKQLPSTPADQREQKEEELVNLGYALKRAESQVNKDRLDRVQREALSKAKASEREKQEHGKKAWHMGRDEKKQLVVKARYEALAKEGGQRAVKRAIEKKQKKIGQKEKRSRPDFKRRRVD